ncbi:hypothetical protein [Halobacterium litoreum]|uniref:Tat (Twin-arginine translocation) pathway signal sequence n=1 Tax=Halobacterium litoreum TaxID=2039234 RepID=A0ABD5NFL6_9EURY|nr:hypothetical protein [Halobacterium litoreum]UHH13459.1 hypothetical protein LT972_00340 [Halobacterium litoreum]
MRRRRVLASVAALAAGSGCARVLGSDPVRVRVMRAPEDRADGETRHCALEADFVADHPVLERVLDSASTAPRGEWVTTGTARDVGDSLAADLRAHCDNPGGLYHFGEETYAVRVEENGERLVEPASTSSEAIRGRQPSDSV